MNSSTVLYQHRINKVIDFINTNLNRSISLSELASVSCFSPYHFHRIFTAVTGETVNDYTLRIRLEKAMNLLKFTVLPIETIAFQCGFSAPSAFSRSFKKYLETSPSQFRKEGEIKNSKICKGLFPVQNYYCRTKEQELKTHFPVEVKEFKKRKIAYIRVKNSFVEGVVLSAYKTLIEWSKSMNLFSTETIFGMSMDDPLVTPKDKYRYEVCITIPDGLKVNHDEIETMIIPRCYYAVSSVKGSFNEVATAIHFLFNHWLINSDFEPLPLGGLEVFNDKDNILDWNHLDLDLCIPIKKMDIPN